jgi:hypothetical protein
VPHSPQPEPGQLSALLADLARVAEGPPLLAAASALRPGGRVSRFELLRELGRGSFGVVFEARDVERDGLVALKVVQAGRARVATDQLQREADTIARLSHPNLVTLLEAGYCDAGPYLVLELLRGQTLKGRLRDGRVAPGEALRVALEVAHGLAHAHERGVVHRDLKPSNVFLCEDGSVRLLDFGLAHAFGRRRLDGGTPDFMAPEQWRGAPEDERTDVFALGILLYGMLAGELPFPDDRGRTVTGSRRAPRLEVADLPGLGEVVGRMLEKDPVDRPRDAAEVVGLLEPLRPRDGSTAGSASGAVRIRWRPGIRTGVAAAAVAALVLGLGVAAAIRWPERRAASGPATPGAPAACSGSRRCWMDASRPLAAASWSTCSSSTRRTAGRSGPRSSTGRSRTSSRWRRRSRRPWSTPCTSAASRGARWLAGPCAPGPPRPTPPTSAAGSS